MSIQSTTKHWRVKWSGDNSLPATEKLLLSRGLVSTHDRDLFFVENPLYQLGDLLGNPLELPDAEQAAFEILKAINNNEDIWIYGDYDVDGVTASAILGRGLKQLGVTPKFYIPHRIDEGFGLNKDAIATIAEKGCKTLVTVDCGASNVEEVEYAKSLGLRVIITDHHTTTSEIDFPVPVVNPIRQTGNYPYREHTGAGVAYSFLRAIVYKSPIRKRIKVHPLIQLAALGTIGDVAPLTGENRLLVKAGLQSMRTVPLVGLRALFQRSGIISSFVNEADLAFKIVPRLNSAGRMSHAKVALKLLLTDDALDAFKISMHLEKLNALRKATTDSMLVEAREMIESGTALNGNIITVAKDGWSPALLGIIAAQLVREYGKPVIVASISGDKARASVRSITGKDIMIPLNNCSSLMLEFGGHSHAAGFTCNVSDLQNIHHHLDAEISNISAIEDLPEVDIEVSPQDINEDLSNLLCRMAPFGQGNPEPRFGISDVQMHNIQLVGSEFSHLKFEIEGASGRRIEVLGFGAGSYYREAIRANTASMIVAPLLDRCGSYRLLRFKLIHLFLA